MKTPDIEIYVKNLTHNILETWLNNTFGAVNITLAPDILVGSNSIKGTVQKDQDSAHIPIIITPKAAGKSYTSLWFQSPETPWENDEECAQSLVEQSGLEVRCSASGWQETEDENSEQWLSITPEEKKLIRWG